MAACRPGLALLTLLAFTAAADDGGRLSLWQVDGDANRVYLLGSIHVLRESDHPLPPGLDAAYDDAEALYMELDFDDLDAAADQATIAELAFITDGSSLGDWLGADAWQRAGELAADARVPLSMLERTEPWFAAINVELMILTRLGYTQEHGIENTFAARAARDDKEIYGFETTRQQLGFLDGLSRDAQRELLLSTLEEGVRLGEIMQGLIDAWRIGDTEYLQRELLDDMQTMSELHDVIVVNRNRAWANAIDELLDDDRDYLVIVGALHLVGREGVPALLAGRGHRVVQLRSQH